MPLDPSKLQSTPSNGLYAELHPDGSVKHYANYRDGQPTGWVLEVSGDRATVSRVQRDDPELADWVETWIVTITEEAEFVRRCSFCGKTQAEVKKLIAGPTTYICNECVELCGEILHEESQIG